MSSELSIVQMHRCKLEERGKHKNTQGEELEYLDDLIETYGFPDWNASLFRGDENNYVVSLPFVKSGSLTAVYRYASYNGSIYHKISDQGGINHYIETNGEDIVSIVFPLIADYVFYDYVLDEQLIQPFIDWLVSNKDTEFQDEVEIRTENELCADIEVCHWITITSASGDGSYHAYIDCYLVEDCYEIPSGPSRPGDPMPNPNPTGGGGNTGTDPNNPNPNPYSGPSSDSDNNNIRDDIDECIKSGSLELGILVKNILDSKITFPCGPEMTPEEMITNIVINAIEKGDSIEGGKICTYKYFKAELDKLNKIIESKSLQDCKPVNCIYNKLLALDNEYTCSTLGEIYDSETYELEIIISDTDLDGNPIFDSGYTEYNPSTGKTTMVLNLGCSEEDPWFSNQSDLDVARLILHEMQHASWIKEMLEANLDPYSFDSFAEFWVGYESHIYSLEDFPGAGANFVHHAVMLHIEDSIRKIASGLHALFGDNNLTSDDFMCSAAVGIYGVMSIEYKNMFDAKYDPICGSSTNLSFNPNSLKCHD